MPPKEIHSELGASGMHRWRYDRCPGSVPLSAGLPKESVSEYAVEGSAAHYLAEGALQGTPVRPSVLYRPCIGDPIKDFPTVTVTAEMLEHLDVYFEHALPVIKRCRPHVAIEQRFCIDWIDDQLFGTGDLIAIDVKAREMWVSDYKNGVWSVPAEDNDQLLYYGLGALGKDNPHHIERVNLTIIQPKDNHQQSKSWQVPARKVYQWAEEVLRPSVAATREEFPQLRIGYWCTFCPAAGICPAQAQERQALIKTDFGDDNGALMVLPPEDDLTPEKISQVIDASKRIVAWAKAVYAHAQRMAEAGHKIPGYKLVHKGAHRKWAPGAEKALAMLCGPENIYTEPALKGIPAIEKEYGKEVAEALWEKPDAGYTLVPEDDRRAEVCPAALDFEEVE